jgi:S-adenosylmethionine-diacylgycerolhomoserine-N-methlytransferase
VDQAKEMDRIYRYQRHIYDLTRKYFLWGRDHLIRQMEIRQDEEVLEIGCGTARNLLALARRNTGARLYGLDVSSEMLRTARIRIRTSRYSHIQLEQCAAEDFHYRGTFGLQQPFHVIFFSYSLSMIPTWRQALSAAVANLQPLGSIYIVDFWDQGNYPSWFRRPLSRWLSLFHVRHEPELINCLLRLHADGHGTVRIESIGYRYAFFASLSQLKDNAEIQSCIIQEQH